MNKANLTHRISRAALILVFALFSATTAWASVITLNENTGEVTLQNGDVLTGTGGENTNVKIADGATVTLSGVNITAISNDNSHQWAGISCLGDAVIVLYEGTTNNVKGGGYNPGIFVPQGHTLTLQGGGTLNATGSYGGAGIGSVDGGSCGAITISGGTVNATGGNCSAGIGSSEYGSCDAITISGGTVNANGGWCAAGIGSGYEGSSCGTVTISGGTVNATGSWVSAGIGSGRESSCGNIIINGGIVTANGGYGGAGIGSGYECGTVTISSGTVNANGGDSGAGIGSGEYGSCDAITISGGTVTATGGEHAAGIGSGGYGSCDAITISGGIVTANGGDSGAGIGSGFSYSSCGDITITNGVAMLIATKGSDSPNTIGAGFGSSCGTVTIGGVTGSITQSPYAYIPNLVTLTPQSEEVTLQNSTVLTGTGGENTRVKIADGATVVLYGVDITAYYNTSSNQRPGISCLGDAVIVLYEGTTNNVKGGGSNPGIFVPQGHTLTLQGGGTLNATGGEKGAGIGSSYHSSCGNITISSGTVTANGGEHGAGIGSSNWSSFGNITISGGTVNANGGQWGAGIGSGCIISSCETITISGGTVTANGGQNAAGIGSGYYNSSCENITITNGVTMVTTTAGQDCDNAIGAGTSGSTCGTVTIGGIETGFITQSPFTTYPYTVGFDANGGSGTMANQGFMYGVAQNLTASSLTNWGHSLEGWATSANGPKVYDDGQSVSNLTQTPGATVTLYAKWITDISVDGDEYTIYTSTGWDLFCDLLANNSNGYFTGKTVKLDADISVTRMAGGSDHAFSGTFDGQGHTLTVSYTTTEQYTAPFRYVNGATITNLVTAGTISTSKKFASGMIGGTLGGAVSITNCKVDVTINSSINGDGTHGGFVALASYGTLNITGCTFSGEMLGENTINCGGFVGWTESNNNATTTITDCLFAPTTLEISSGRTFSRARNMSSVTITNCYYTEPLGTAQGHPAVSDPTIQPAGNPTATYSVSGITTYANGMLYGETFYYNPDMITYIGSGDGTSTYLPLNNYFNYSLTEQIYTAEELGEAGAIERIGFFKNSNKSCERNIVIYMVYTDKDEFESTSDWITVTETDRVFSGTVNFDDYSWTDITLDEFFVYDGLHNVIIVVDDNTGGYNSTTYFSTFPTEVGQALYQYSDGTNFDPTGTLVDSRDVLSQKNQLRIFKNELGDCMKTSRLTATEVGPNFVMLDWYEYGTSENWLVRYNGAYVEANEHPFTLTGLAPETEYTIAVSPICDTSLWSRALTLTTRVACPAPFNVEVDNITYNSANVTWTGYSDSYTVHYRTASTIAEVVLDEGFEGGVMPDGWYVEGDTQDTTKTWRVGVGDNNTSTGTHSGNYNALITHFTSGNETYLITPVINLSGLSNVNLSFWYINRIWSGDIDGFAVCYREGDYGDWEELWSTIENHQTWTFLTIDLTGLPDNCQIGFRMTDNYGRGVGLDDVLIGTEQIGEWEEITTTATSQALSSLVPETEYEVYVTADCDSTAVSETVNFTTSIQTVFTFTKDIEGYGYEANPGGWYLIASPVVEAIAPSEENGFITIEYDLYYFNQSTVGEEWRNYKDSDFLLTNGTGYLYASELNTTLIFTGTPYTGDGEIELAYDLASPELAGWNLVGNPYAVTAYVDREFYTMNSNGSEIIASTSGTVEVMEGIFVVADYDGETMTFSPITRGTQREERIVLNLSKGALTDGSGVSTGSTTAVIDRAIVRFGEGKQLPKFQIDPNHTKVYIPMDGKDYAVVRSESMDEMPINFKAEHNGTYTLTFSTENVDFDYLHLIDNLTGADVDLLAGQLVPEPVEGPVSYTFTAKTTDYESRFKLVFSTNEDGPSTGSGAFAFINNGNIIVNGEGTIQVIDMMGHVVYQGNAINRVSTGGMTPGVYMLRLIDGDNVRTQKIVIE